MDLYVFALVSDQSMKPNWHILANDVLLVYERYVIFNVSHSFYLTRTFIPSIGSDQFFKWKGPISQLR